MKIQKVQLTTLRCYRCDHRWIPKQIDVRICPKCKSEHWQTPRPKGNRQGLRKGKTK